MGLKFTILGCGNSSGVPAVGNYWGACDPHEPKNRRTRCSAAIQSDKTTLIIDTGADFREQMNRHEINDLDAVLYTHDHSDHTHGIDDLRSLFFRHKKTRVNTYGKSDALNELARRFHFLYVGGNNDEFYPPILAAHPFEETQYGHPYTIGDITFTPFEMDHGTCIALGYRFGNLSYCTDMKSLDQKALDAIKGSEIWIVDAAAYKNTYNDVHADLQTIYRYNEYIQAKSVYVTSLSSQMDYKTLQSELHKGFYPAYDGLSFMINN